MIRREVGVISQEQLPIEVLQLTDLHLFADPSQALRGTVTAASLQAVLTHYKSSGWKARHALVTGDLIQDDTQAAYAQATELLSSLDLPMLVIPGNHDVRSLMMDAMSSAPFDYCGNVQSGNWQIIGIDSCRAGHAGGRVSDDELQRLLDVLSNSDAEHIAVCMHHPPVPMKSTWLDSVGLEAADEFLMAVRQTGKVRLVLFGHAHQQYDQLHDGIRILGTPATCRQFKPQSDEFAVDDRPPAYRRITLRADGSFDSELVWLDGD